MVSFNFRYNCIYFWKYLCKTYMKSFIIIGIIIIVLIIAYIALHGYEKFTNEAGYYCDNDKCDSFTLSKCLNCSNCSWCMRDGFDSKCVSGTASDLLNSGTCDKVYANDVFTRALMAGDNDYKESEKLPLFE